MLVAQPHARGVNLHDSSEGIGIGIALVAAVGQRYLGLIQLCLVAGYTIGFGLLMADLWGDPFGRLVKNIPVLAAIGVWMALRDER